MLQGHIESRVEGFQRTAVRIAAGLGALLIALVPVGCGRKQMEARIPAPPPTIITPLPDNRTMPPVEPAPPKEPRWVQTGLASWYVPEPAGRRTSSGEPYIATALTAAHRTLPLNTLVRVTNLNTQRTAVVRINDRGPFRTDRIIDLSVAAAKAVDVWRAGTARVKLEVVDAPAPIETGGRWCIQIGAFHKQTDALQMKEKLMRHYLQDRVLQFASPTGYWVRVRVKDDDRYLAQELASKLKVGEGGVFLVRLD